MKRLLLMSSARKGNMGYLEHAPDQLKAILDGAIKQVLFIPYAAVTRSFDDYEASVKPVYERLGVEIMSIHRFGSAEKALEKAEAVAVGGGNTFVLLKRLYDNRLIEAVRKRVENGLPYMGWSAGTNVACPTIRTTNDMPVVMPPSMGAFALVPFQINPHFVSGKPAGHNGESREERLEEFLAMNPAEGVVALREGSALYVEGDEATLLGGVDSLVFRRNRTVETIAANGRFVLNHING